MAVIHRAPHPAPNRAARIRAPRHEVIEGTGMRAMIAHGSAEARAWDGADPIRSDPIRIIDASAAA
ncbi:glyoxalase [Burkholderia ambifaria]|uniref:glyoxalase n=1 Tax=Burkholderia ambifaria TaxID=152480 RepID=UPI00158CA044|nr:glyoxalase [Burkholderia ambifaria]